MGPINDTVFTMANTESRGSMRDVRSSNDLLFARVDQECVAKQTRSVSG